jgi:hypothetical protein
MQDKYWYSRYLLYYYKYYYDDEFTPKQYQRTQSRPGRPSW